QPRESFWDARLLMERSRAVMGPDISAHLAATLADLYTPDMGAERDKTVSMALAAAERLVLKPQREGGGTAGGQTHYKKKNLLKSLSLLSYRQDKDMVINECVGRLLRTRSSGHSDGGVAAGVTAHHNPLLF
uniref:Uncharacterized protein n=1 Tax=Oreochromis niloticus TaxID=8128 RepID=A0A669CNJ1_ORENI